MEYTILPNLFSQKFEFSAEPTSGVSLQQISKFQVSRVSYAGEEIVIPGRIEDLENDVIYSIEEERED